MMTKVLTGLFLLLALMTSHSSATYCLCKDEAGDEQLQANLDYACGALVDCSAIQPNGVCYEPNTVKSHCDYAVNSYFQKAGQEPGSCYFSGSATTSDQPPSNVASGCVYPSSPAGSRAPPRSTTPVGTDPARGSGRRGFPGTPAGEGPRSSPSPGTPISGTVPTGTVPSGTIPTGAIPQGSGAAALYIASALTTLGLSALVFLWSH